MKIDQLKAFVAVVETGSFRSAADKLFKTQPTISAAVQTLEQQFDVQLLSRETYRPTLTSEGQQFFKHAKHTLSQFQQLEKLGYEIAEDSQKDLTICLSPTCMNNQCLSAIKTFNQENRSIRLNMASGHLQGVEEQLRLGHSEVVIGPRYGVDDRHELIEIMQINMVTVIAPNIFSTNETHQQIAQNKLHPFPHILIENSASDSKNNEHIHVLPSGRQWYVNDYQVKKSLVLSGMGWARIPLHFVKTELDKKQLVLIDIENFQSNSIVPIYMIRLRNQAISHQAHLFWQSMTNSFNNDNNEKK